MHHSLESPLSPLHVSGLLHTVSQQRRWQPESVSGHVSSVCLHAAREVHQPAAAQHQSPGGQGQGEAAAPRLRQDQGLRHQRQSAGPGRAQGKLSHRYSTPHPAERES